MMSQTQTLYGTMDSTLFEKLKSVKLLVCDVDGVFSDGRIYLGNEGEELKAFHTRDGYGIKAIVKNGVTVAVVTGRDSQIVERRMRALNVAHIVQGQEDKRAVVAHLQQSLGLNHAQIAVMGDDMPDLGMFDYADIRIAVNDAHPLVKSRANWVTTIRGGFGAVREVSDTLLQAFGKLEQVHGASV